MKKKVRVTMPMKDLAAERSLPDYVQCRDLYMGRSYVFCLRNRGHDGDHRGQGAQWQTIDSRDEQ